MVAIGPGPAVTWILLGAASLATVLSRVLYQGKSEPPDAGDRAKKN